MNRCSVNGRSWFFAGGLTKLEVTIKVTDTTTGQTKSYYNPQGLAFLPIADTAAFGCPAGAEALSRNPEEPAEDELASMSARASAPSHPASEAGCDGTDTVLCVDGRFQVEATWQTASGRTGPAHAVPLTSESGYFWFFDSSNVELVVKTLDACGIGRGEWFFAAGLTTVGVQVRVTDTFTGEVRNYASPLGARFLPIQDTAAFSFCPTATPTSAPTETPTPTLTPTPTPIPQATRSPRPTGTPRPTPTLTPTPQVHTVSLVCVSESCNDNKGAHCIFNFPSPSTIHIRVGDTVNWDWSHGIHSITWGAPLPMAILTRVLRPGRSCSRTRSHGLGPFHYYCSPGHMRAFRDPAGPCLVYLGHEGGASSSIRSGRDLELSRCRARSRL